MRFAFGLALVLWCASAHAQPDAKLKAGPSVADAPCASHRFEQFELESADGARHYRVQLAIPRTAAPAAGFPVLYVLDGNAAFADLTSEQLEAHPSLVVVAIGYATDLRFDMGARAYDYTPSLSDELYARSVDAARGRRIGGADAFLKLLETRIKPAVARHARIDRARQTLWGHSYGGLFALHVMFRRPSAFQAYVAAEPSFWWGEGYLLRAEQRRATRLLIVTGSDAPAPAKVEDEAVLRMQRARAAVPADTVPRFVERQRARHCAFEGVAHGPLLARSLGPALAFAMGAADPCEAQ